MLLREREGAEEREKSIRFAALRERERGRGERKTKDLLLSERERERITEDLLLLCERERERDWKQRTWEERERGFDRGRREKTQNNVSHVPQIKREKVWVF
mgnify:CR=1 FL=1